MAVLMGVCMHVCACMCAFVCMCFNDVDFSFIIDTQSLMENIIVQLASHEIKTVDLKALLLLFKQPHISVVSITMFFHLFDYYPVNNL